MELAFGVIVGVVIVVLLVILHELGHALAARRNGVVVEEFGIGFPPAAWSKKYKNRMTQFLTKDELLFSINWLPLGGFVKLKGEYDSAKKKGDYGAATFWQKTKILLAGVAVNWITAVVLLTILAWTGLPKILPDQYSVAGDTRTVAQPLQIAVGKDSPAEKAGLKTGDSIQNLGGAIIATPDDLSKATKAHQGEKVAVIYQRDNKLARTNVQLNGEKDKAKGYLGVTSSIGRTMIYTTWSAPVVGVVTTAQLTAATFDGLGKLVLNIGSGIAAQFSSDQQAKKAGSEELEAAKDSVSGPIGIYGVLFPAATSAGPTMLVFITAVISLSLAVINVLPIPALDGGRWFTMAVFRLLKKPLTKEREETIQTAGFLTLMALIVVVTIVDVSKFVK